MKVPAPSLEKATMPVGALAVPTEVSVTVTEQEAATLTSTGFGEQLTRVEVVRRLTVIVEETVEELALCVVSVALGV